jgi:hypothetical protein
MAATEKIKIPFFHYTHLESLPSIVADHRIKSRFSLVQKGTKFSEISIDPTQQQREKLGLTNYVPLFPGFYALFRSELLFHYLEKEYDAPKVQNKSFYGTLNKVLQFKQGIKYDCIVILLINDEFIYTLADQGKVRFFSDIAIKGTAIELPVIDRDSLKLCLLSCIEGTNISGEIDLLDEGEGAVPLTSVDAIIVDNKEVGKQVIKILTSSPNPIKTKIFLMKHPRNSPCKFDFDF